jgi:hypothetical protein
MGKLLRVTFIMSMLCLSMQQLALAQQSVAPCDVKLPEQVGTEMRAKFVGWRIETTADLSNDHQQMWEKTHSLECPGLASGHFTSASRLSYALLLVSKDPKVFGYRLLVADSDAESSFHLRVLQRFDQPISSDVVVYRTPPGKYFQPEKSGDVSVSLDGIVLESMESGAFLFHWQKDRYVRTLVSE